MHEESKHLLTINTPRGLLRFNRLPFGVKVAPAIFQETMDKLISGLSGVAAYLDDIIVVGATREEHNTRVCELFKRFAEAGFKVRMEKCSLFETSVPYLGFIIDAEGRKPDPRKSDAILNMPAPKNVPELRSLLGMITHYAAFVNKLRSMRGPLDALLQKDVAFEWTEECQRCFEQVKNVLISDLLLTHYDPNLPIVVAADASNYGVGAVIYHTYSDGSEKVIYHASRSLTKTEQKYAQIEKEALALVFAKACQRFHKFICGRKFTLYTDHKPLLMIFGSKKGLPVYTASRLKRWGIMLLGYQFDIRYKKTTEFGNADVLSRLIAAKQELAESEDEVIAALEQEIIGVLTETIHCLPTTLQEVRDATANDKTLQDAMKYLHSGRWPTNLSRQDPLNCLYNRRDGLSVQRDCLLFGSRIVVPNDLQDKLLRELHKTHPGMTRMKQLARGYMYWPSIDVDIESLVRNCQVCIDQSRNPVKVPVRLWPQTTKPFERIHIDYAGPIDGKMFLIVVDAYSTWPEVYITNTATTTNTIHALQNLFARFGNPHTMVSDNGTQFTSHAFDFFCKSIGAEHVRTAPFHPQSNGLAERFVDIFKRRYLKLRKVYDVKTAKEMFLQAYRASPNSSGQTPAERFLNRKIRTPLDLITLKEEVDRERRKKAEPRTSKDKEYFDRHHGARQKSFHVGQQVWVRDFRVRGKNKWTKGEILEQLGKVMYKVKTPGSTPWQKLPRRTSGFLLKKGRCRGTKYI